MPKLRQSSKIQRFLLERGEWLAVGFAAVTISHALFATQWIPCTLAPQDLKSRVATARTEMAKTIWPESERTRFEFGKETTVAETARHALHEPIDLTVVSASLKPYHRLGAEKPPLEEPVLYPVMEFIASSERALLRKFPTAPIDTPILDEETAPVDVTPDEFRPRGGQPVRRPAVERRITKADVERNAARLAAEKAAWPTGRGYPFVSVRGLIDVPQQVRAYVDAIHQAYPLAERTFEIIDFELERQRSTGNSGWTAWEPVDRSVYFDVVQSAGGIEPDVIDVALTDSTITGPLPKRLTGRWNKTATHPRLAEFALTKEELERELEYLRALTQRAGQRPARPGVIQKRGFAGLVQDVRAVQQSVFNTGLRAQPSRPQFGTATTTTSADRQMQQLLQEVVRDMRPGAVDPQLVQWVRARATAQRRYLLFRFLDFDVMPGETYRYRVRLEVLNPNFGRSLAVASNSTVVSGVTRRTPWSEATPPVMVDSLANYFLSGLEPAKVRPAATARMHVYQYEPDAGTTAEHVLAVVPGQAIGGRARVSRPNPVTGNIDDGPYDFRTSDSLVDGIADLTLSANEHPDLKLPGDARGRAFVTEMVLISQPGRGLRIVDTVSQSPDYARQQQSMRWQDEQFESLQRAILEPGFGSTADEGDESFGPSWDRRNNPLQKL